MFHRFISVDGRVFGIVKKPALKHAPLHIHKSFQFQRLMASTISASNKPQNSNKKSAANQQQKKVFQGKKRLTEKEAREKLLKIPLDKLTPKWRKKLEMYRKLHLDWRGQKEDPPEKTNEGKKIHEKVQQTQKKVELEPIDQEILGFIQDNHLARERTPRLSKEKVEKKENQSEADQVWKKIRLLVVILLIEMSSILVFRM